MNPIDKDRAGNGQPEPPEYPGRDLPPPPIGDPPGDPGSDPPPMRDPPRHPEGDRPKIA